MRNPTPAPIIVPAIGAPTCRGVALRTAELAEWTRERDLGDADDHVRMQAERAVADLHILCLRPTADRPACVGLSPTQFAVQSLQADFAARALVVDPYDAEGNDLREERPTVGWTGTAITAEEAHLVAVWEGSEAT